LKATVATYTVASNKHHAHKPVGRSTVSYGYGRRTDVRIGTHTLAGSESNRGDLVLYLYPPTHSQGGGSHACVVDGIVLLWSLSGRLPPNERTARDRQLTPSMYGRPTKANSFPMAL
jgi:hypothetical protein